MGCTTSIQLSSFIGNQPGRPCKNDFAEKNQKEDDLENNVDIPVTKSWTIEGLGMGGGGMLLQCQR